MKVVCAWCGEDMGTKDGEGVSHSICDTCYGTIQAELPAPNQCTCPAGKGFRHQHAPASGDSQE